MSRYDLVSELRAAVGDSPDDLDWTEELFARAADAIESAPAECDERSRAFEDAVKVANSARQKVVELQAVVERVRNWNDSPPGKRQTLASILATSGTEALEAVKREAKAEALEEAADTALGTRDGFDSAQEAAEATARSKWLRTRAAEYRKTPETGVPNG